MSDYFQDILPPDGPVRRDTPQTPPPASLPEQEPAEKSIRNINITRSRPLAAEKTDPFMPKPPRLSSSFMPSGRVWLIAALALFVLGILSLFLFRTTTVTVVPRTHTIIFDNTASLTAYPATAAASGTLPYLVETFTFEDSEVVPAQGTKHVESKASGSITIYNDFSEAPVKLVATTRFETPEGLVYRVPAQVIVPGKKGNTPGSIQVTVVADAVGPAHNVGPVSRFTLPGLKNGTMYEKVYAQSNAAFTGGFSGEQPQTAPGALESATAQIRTRLEQKVRDGLAALPAEKTAFIELARTTYAEMPNAAEGADKVRVTQKAVVSIPVFDTATLAGTLAESVSADAQTSTVHLVPAAGFSVTTADVASTTLGADPISFALGGKAQLVWEVDSAALAQALAGRDESAFDAIVGGFPFVQEAKARIEPFWKSTFPKDPAGISVIVQEAPKP